MTVAPEFDPLSPAMLENPYPVYAELQEKHPVFWHDQVGAWVVTRYADCREILMDTERFVRDPRRVGEASADSGASLQSIDEASQSGLRRLVIGSIHAQNLESEVAAPVSATITAEFLGVHEPDPRVFKAIGEGMARKFDADIGEHDAEAARRTREGFGMLIDSWLNDPGTHGTMLSLKEQARELGVPLPVIKNSIGLLFIGSYGTIFAASGSLARMVMSRPEVFEQLGEPGLLGTGVEEFLRYDGPTHATSRVATRDTEVGGVGIKQGDPVFIVLAAANRDPAQFPAPQELLLDRTPNKHLAFGWGPHSCVGSLFGQLALGELTRALHDAPARLRPAGEPTRLRTATIRSYISLPVTFAA
jgi:cytochrome P450